MAPVRRRAITEKEKKELRNYFFNSSDKPTQSDLISWFRQRFDKDLSQPSVSQILSSRYSYLDSLNDIDGDVKRNRPAKYPILEKLLFEWQQRAQSQNQVITGEAIKETASKLWKKIPEYKDLSTPEFSNGWLENFKRRHQQFQNHANKEQPYLLFHGSMVETVTRISDITTLAEPENVFALCEMGLFWKLTPSKIYAVEEAQGMKRDKARITTLLCTNATGTRKLPMWAIGYSQNPKAFRAAAIKPEVLNFHWRFNGRACLTTILIEEWLLWFDSQMQKGKVILLLERSTAVVCALQNLRNANRDLKNTSVIILPGQQEKSYNPFDYGITFTLKAFYRKYWIRYMLAQIELGRNPHKTVNVLHAMRWLTKAWEIDILPASIYSSFCQSSVLRDFDPVEPELSYPAEVVGEIQNSVARFDTRSAENIHSFIDPIEERPQEVGNDVLTYVASQFLPDRDHETDEEDEPHLQTTLNGTYEALDYLINFEAQREGGDPSFIMTLLRYQNTLEDWQTRLLK
ncbi:ARS-binding protein [Schizosaccharomyces octosporus yFS286]|uniref:ARS-binding protein n=1 Tax=Schizosaccharomyces octosporus (strain yFS286) TaxID=483514 RepID=S9Q4J5_SCHOY|nr:ARS-binding protein [Schizosaccharomyces octosporus yFS286]EPX74558.1 ARS-binding protein [Schizosaccharomyces octosporus yFS286]